jgi:hypothetical protein
MMNFTRKIFWLISIATMLALPAVHGGDGSSGVGVYLPPAGQVCPAVAQFCPAPGLFAKQGCDQQCQESKQAAGHQVSKLEQETKEFANSFGNKFANLQVMQETVGSNQQLKKKLTAAGGYSVEVPAFVGVAKIDVQD